MRFPVIAMMAGAVGALSAGGAAMADWYVSGGNATPAANNHTTEVAVNSNLLDPDGGNPALGHHTDQYGFGDGAYEFASFSTHPEIFGLATNLASVLQNPNSQSPNLHALPGAWNNSGNTIGGFTGQNAGPLNTYGAQWIHNSADNENGHDDGSDDQRDGVSVLYRVQFTAVSTVTRFELYYLTDNGLGNTNGANGTGIPESGYANDGIWVNGAEPVDHPYSSPGASGAPAQFASIQHISFTANTVVGSNNYFYFYQFNWGGPGGSAFALEVVPLPPAGWSGLSTLAGIGVIGLVRRRRIRAS